MSKTLIFLNGADTKKLNNCIDEKYSMLNPEYYKNSYEEIIFIGDKLKGIKLDELTKQLSEISERSESIDIIVTMHGGFKDKSYYLELEHNNLISGEKFLKVIAKNLNKPIKILFSSCYGANIHKYALALKPGSMLISFSNSDKSTYSVDFCSKYMLQYMDLFSKEKLTIEYLSLVYCLTQYKNQNSPVITKIDNFGNINSWQFDKYFIENHVIQFFSPSNNLRKLFDVNQHLKSDYLLEAGKNITDKNYWSQIKQKEKLIESFLSKKINFEEYLKQYYFNYEELLAQINSGKNIYEDLYKHRVFSDAEGNRIVYINMHEIEPDFTFKTQKEQIRQLQSYLNEYKKNFPTIILPDGIKLKESASIFSDLSLIQKNHDTDKTKSKIDKDMMNYFEACDKKYLKKLIEDKVKSEIESYNESTILVFLYTMPPQIFTEKKGQFEPDFFNFHDPIHNLISKFGLEQAIAGDQILQKLAGELNTHSDMV